MIASATNGTPVTGSGVMQDFQQPLSISRIILRFFEMSPARMDSIFGMIPGFLTMYYGFVSVAKTLILCVLTAINSEGSPPIG